MFEQFSMPKNVSSSFSSTNAITVTINQHWTEKKTVAYNFWLVQSSLTSFSIFRVTRLGEFSPFGRLFSLASLLKISEVAQILGLLFSTAPVMY
jgi:hypothetical protein